MIRQLESGFPIVTVYGERTNSGARPGGCAKLVPAVSMTAHKMYIMTHDFMA
ncbi:hypothetical protein LVJ94_18525 [Pendulispora rubella]|uniref:Uncharacterized protein n=1 Tax=Pendulispora rubella TaxID=2741070 RepID=A0ABZ2LE62_9BACT